MPDRTAIRERVERFVQEYLLDLNATEAAKRAGYSAKTAASQGWRLLRNVEIQARVTELQQERAARVKMDADRVLEELAALGTSNIAEVLDFDGDSFRLKAPETMSTRARRAIRSVKVKRYIEGSGDNAREVESIEFTMHDKSRALDLIGRHLGMWTRKIELSGRVSLEDLLVKVKEIEDTARGRTAGRIE